MPPNSESTHGYPYACQPTCTANSLSVILIALGHYIIALLTCICLVTLTCVHSFYGASHLTKLTWELAQGETYIGTL